MGSCHRQELIFLQSFYTEIKIIGRYSQQAINQEVIKPSEQVVFKIGVGYNPSNYRVRHTTPSFETLGLKRVVGIKFVFSFFVYCYLTKFQIRDSLIETIFYMVLSWLMNVSGRCCSRFQLIIAAKILQKLSCNEADTSHLKTQFVLACMACFSKISNSRMDKASGDYVINRSCTVCVLSVGAQVRTCQEKLKTFTMVVVF